MSCQFHLKVVVQLQVRLMVRHIGVLAKILGIPRKILVILTLFPLSCKILQDPAMIPRQEFQDARIPGCHCVY